MKLRTGILSIFAVLGTLAFTFSSPGEYTNKNAKVIARNTIVFATIGGEVEQQDLVPGSSIKQGQSIAVVTNPHVDTATLANLENEKASLELSVQLLTELLNSLDAKTDIYQERNRLWKHWHLSDLESHAKQLAHDIRSSQAQFNFRKEQASSADKLLAGSAISKFELGKSKHSLEQARHDLLSKQVKHDRMLNRITMLKENDPVILPDGNASYWNRLADEFESKSTELRLQLAEKKNKLVLVQGSIEIERTMFNAKRQENHLAKFDGLVNAVYARTGDLVTPNTPILEILDCNQLTVLVPIPSTRQAYFFAGQKATVTMHGTTDSVTGRVQLISTGSLMSRDKTIAADQSLLQGHNLIISLDPQSDGNEICDVEKNATVTLKIDSDFAKWISYAKSLIPINRTSAVATPAVSTNIPTTLAQTPKVEFHKN